MIFPRFWIVARNSKMRSLTSSRRCAAAGCIRCGFASAVSRRISRSSGVQMRSINAVISPVGVLSHQGQDVTVNDRKVGELSPRLFQYLTRYQRGEEDDTFGWRERIDLLDIESLTQP